MPQKITRVGNSAAVIINQQILSQLGLQTGDPVELIPNPDSNTITITTAKSSAPPTLTPEFKTWLDSFIHQHQTILNQLSQM